MGIEESIVDWFSQNGYPIWLAIGLAVLFQVVKEFVWEKFATPSIKAAVRYQKSRISKIIRNAPVDITYSSYIASIEEHHVPMDRIRDVAKALRENKVPVTEQGDLKIDNYQVGKLRFNGTIEFGTRSSKDGEVITDFDITLTTQAQFRSLSEDITTIVYSIGKLKEYIQFGMNLPVKYSDTLSCKITKPMEFTWALKELNITHLQFMGDSGDISVTKDKITFARVSEPAAIVKPLKRLVTLYT